MSEFNFEQLKDIDFNIPESWIENALIVPPKKRKPAVPVMFYRYAASAAACVILAAAVIFSLIFGINKDVDMTDPDSDKTSAVERATGDASSTDPSGEDSVIGNIPWVFGGDSESSTFVTEPAETDADGNKTNNRSSKSKQRASTPSNGSTKPSSKNSEKTNNGSSGEQKATDPGNSEDETAVPATEEPWLPPPWEEPTEYWPEPWEPETQEPWFAEPTDPEPEQPAREFHFSIYAKLASVDDAVYCKVTDKDGNVVSNGSANIKFYGSGYSLVGYTTYQKAAVGDPFTVCFYRADGGVYTTQKITTCANNNFALGFYKKATY